MSVVATTGQNGGPSQLHQLFRTCDREGKGFIVEEELRELCSSLGIAADDSDIIFSDLDQDQDGKISYTEFSKGFTEFLNPGVEAQVTRRFSTWNSLETEMEEGVKEVECKRRESVYQAWSCLTSSLTQLTKTNIAAESGAQIRELLQDLETSTAPLDVASRVSTVLSTLLTEIQHLQDHHHSLEKLYQKEREHHATALKSLESELEDQVAKVEEKAKQKARQESEDEKRQLQDQMDQEMAELQTHLKIFQKVDSWLKKEDGEGVDRMQEVRRKLEEAYHANRTLNMTLNETTTNLGLMRSDMAQMRLQYEEKCRELHNERETVLEYMHQYDHMKRQLELLHEANKRLQDTNDSMRSAVEHEWRRSPIGSRCSSTRSSLHRSKERKRSHRSCSISTCDSSRSRSPHPSILSSFESDGGLKYGIRRLMDDLDTAEEGCNTQDELKLSENEGPLSLEEELLSLESPSPPATHQPQTDVMLATLRPIDGNTQGVSSPPTPTPPPILEVNTPPLKPRRVNQLVPPTERNGGSPQHQVSSGMRTNNYEALGPPERTYKVVFAGDAAVGKSTFIVRLCRGCFVINIASTLGVDYKVKTLHVDEKNIAIQLWDTAGQERFRSITKTYFRRADGVLLLYDVTSERSFLNVRQWIQSIDEACDSRVPLVLCGNKMDLRVAAAAEGRITISSADGERLARDCGALFLETSCKSGFGVLEALVQLARQMVTTEDVEVQTSALKVCASEEKKSCCGTKKER
ncbi:ras and EF-hand domain-containing protein homolog isoform X3 [Homarus americanus]|uniref:ras and EF-hand domain-containing protein homolog isoform X3 n=1 Tax=Homarus americanus TaxID=6706 RepID=UPI001C4572E2|nr:ras and EF-hand domain-containing protein homolog isoform X3 [Homarus americanus]